MSFDLTAHLSGEALKISNALEALLESKGLPGEVQRPERLLAAMRHGALNGGKRIRPVLLIETACLFGFNEEGALLAGCALECVHCYSLVHDDLPAMDDDDLRRGQPTVHVAYDEATAILAGDALLTLAFDIITDDRIHDDPKVRLFLARELARASGLGGMAGGQMLDLESENRERSELEIRTLQSMKTGALLRYACRAGAILGSASEEDLQRLTRFGEIIGLAFQLADDLLDIEASTEALGKTAGKDIEAGKATLVSLLGAETARKELNALSQEARTLLEPYGDKAKVLKALAVYIAERSH